MSFHTNRERHEQKHNEPLKKVRRSKKNKTIKQQHQDIANVRGLKSKLRDIKMILFNTEPDIAASVETNLETQEKIAVSGYTYVGKERQYKGGGLGYFIKDTIKNSCTVEPDNNTTTEML